MALLSVHHLTRRFGGVIALDDVSFDVPQGQILGLIGPNGAGKTTAFNVITRLYKPDSGAVLYDGEDLLKLAPYEVVRDVAANGRLPVVNFVAGGISTPADAALVMQLGAEGVFVGSGIFKSEDPARMANAIVQATTFFDDAKKIAEVAKGLGAPMRGIALEDIPEQERLAVRGW